MNRSDWAKKHYPAARYILNLDIYWTGKKIKKDVVKQATFESIDNLFIYGWDSKISTTRLMYGCM